MAKDPAFLFYPGDWLSGTMYLTHEQKGAYMDLLILQFNCGEFTEAQAKQVLSTCFDVAWLMLKQKFKFKDGHYFNERLKAEIEKRKSFSESRRNNAKGTKKTKINLPEVKASVKHMLKHMEDENINEDIIINNNHLSENQSKVLNDLIAFFGYSGIHHKKQQSLAFCFMISLNHTNRFDFFEKQFKAYCELKLMDGYPHTIENYLGKQSEAFVDGKWDDNWKERLLVYKQKNGMPVVNENAPKKETVIEKKRRKDAEAKNGNS